MTLAARTWAGPGAVSGAATRSPEERFAAVAREQLDFVWRVLRRQGLSRADADDGVQRVFLLFREKAANVAAGTERGFLFRAAGFVAKELRRSVRSCEEATESNLGTAPSPSGPVELGDLLDKVMRDLDEDERAVFHLFEIEGLTMAEIANIVRCPAGTVASRLRRARDKVRAAAARMDLCDGGAPWTP
jgi:RNA polymerase sigma-70 factor (ECF subfamily)